MARATTTKTLRKPAAAKAAPSTAKVTAAPVAAKPTLPKHQFTSGWTGASDGINQRPSRTMVDSNRFGSLKDAPLTERDQMNLAALRQQFGGKAFVRSNIDAGILRRLGERGYIAKVSGADNEATATYKLTGRKAA